MVLTPIARNIPNRSLAIVAILIPLPISMANNKITKNPPINPLSSARTEKIKSLGATEEGKISQFGLCAIIMSLA